MRKTIVYTLCTAMLCAVLCGCGNQNQRRDDMVIGTPVVPEMTPMVSPMVTPDPRDGYVDDEDGIIEEKETGNDKTAGDAKKETGNDKTAGDAQKGKTQVSPSPEVSARP